jgi:hypothetical protein
VKHYRGIVAAAIVVAGVAGAARAEGGKGASAVLDKAIKALGGEEKLKAARMHSQKLTGTITINGEDNKFSILTTTDGHGKYRSDVDGEFMGNKIEIVTVLNGDKGWRKFADMKMELDKEGLANERRNVFLGAVGGSLLALKHKEFKVEDAADEMVDGHAAAVIKVTEPGGKDFKLYFSKDSGLPLKLVASKVVGFMGDDATQEWHYSKYKEIAGIKKAAHIDVKRSGEKLMTMDLADFEVLKDVDAKKFDEPK